MPKKPIPGVYSCVKCKEQKTVKNGSEKDTIHCGKPMKLDCVYTVDVHHEDVQKCEMRSD